MKTYIKNRIEFLKENISNNKPVIEITPIKPDERSNKKNKEEYHVNYQITKNGDLMEIEGILKPYHSGRSQDYEFEPNYFMDEKSEEYWDNNWDIIEDQILTYFLNNKK
jgi:hypothetical protein